MTFKKVVLADMKTKNYKTYIIDESEMCRYNEIVSKIEYPCEMVGAPQQQVKPYFDVDKLIDSDADFDMDMDIFNYKIIIQKLFNLDDVSSIYHSYRNPRQDDDKIKCSYHFTIDNIRISNYNIKKMLINANITDFDTAVYDKNRGIACIGNNKKPNSEKMLPQFQKGNENDDISKYCISYIQEDFKDWDCNFPVKEPVNTLKDIINVNFNDYELVEQLINCLSIKRADDYKLWLDVGFCLYNINEYLCELWDNFSSKSSKYIHGECEKLWSKMTKKNMSIASLKYWAKQDNPDEYANIINNSVDKYIDLALNSDGSHYDIAVVISMITKDKIKYDSKIKSWYVINQYNVWKEDNEALFMNTLCGVEICKSFLKRSFHYSAVCEDPILRAINEEKAKKCMKIATQLKNTAFVKSVLAPLKSLMSQNDFVESKLDSKTYIFCFDDCLYDLQLCKIRNIEPEDYVLTTTGYCYNNSPDENVTSDIYKFLRDIHIDEENYQYNLDVMTSCLVGENIYQELYFKTGSGANGKSTEQALCEHAFGKYASCPNAEVLTKEKKGANETSELHESKGKRLLLLQEPESNDKIITSKAKKLTGGDKLSVRGLFRNPIEITPQFKIIMSLNDMVEFSKVDGGIQRRTRIINYPFKFVDNVENDMQKKRDVHLENKFRNDTRYRDAYINILINNWTNIKGIKKLNTPKSVIEDSEEHCTACNPVLGFFDNKIDITNNPDDKIMCKVLLEMYNNCNRDKITATALGCRIRDMGIKKIRYGRAQIFYYCGIKVKDEEDQE